MTEYKASVDAASKLIGLKPIHRMRAEAARLVSLGLAQDHALAALRLACAIKGLPYFY